MLSLINAGEPQNVEDDGQVLFMILSKYLGTRSMRLMVLCLVVVLSLNSAAANAPVTPSPPFVTAAECTTQTNMNTERATKPPSEADKIATETAKANLEKVKAETANLQKAQANAKEIAMISADAQVKAASIQAAASVASAAIGAMAQLASQKDSGGQQGGQAGTEVKAPETGATADLAQMPPGAVAEITPKCVGLVAPTEAQIRTCTALGYVLNGNVLVPANQVTASNNNPANGPNLLVPVGSSTSSVEQLVNLPPGGVVEATINPAQGGNGATGSTVAAPIRIKDVLTEGVVIGDFRTNTIARYPAAATGDKPPLKAWATGVSVWGNMPALWPQYQIVGKSLATFNYQSGGASDNPPSQTINIGQVAPNYIKIVPNIDDARIDLKGTRYNEIATIIRNGKFFGSSDAAGILAVGGKAIQKYLLQSPTGGASYVVAGPYVRANDGGKIIQSSQRVGPNTLTSQQCEIIYGGPCNLV